MGQQKEGTDLVAAEPSAGGGGGVSLGKGAWDCDNNVEIPAEAEVGFIRSSSGFSANVHRLSSCSWLVQASLDLAQWCNA